MSEIEEIWVDIEGFEKIYQVSNFGRVRSMQRVVTHSNGRQVTLSTHVLPLTKTVDQVRVHLRHNGKRTYYSVHLLVGKYFIPNPNGLKHLKRLDGNVQNNHFQNLEWYKPRCFVAEYRKKFGPPRKGELHPRVKVQQISIETGEVLATWHGMKSIALGLGFTHSHIIECCTGKRITAYGFMWNYAPAETKPDRNDPLTDI